MKSPRIVTHLFADGGRIIKTSRTSYAELVGRADLAQVVRQMMKEQHRSMFAALRAGELDALLEAACGPLPLPPVAPRDAAPALAKSEPAPAPPPAQSAREPLPSSGELSNPNLRALSASAPPAPSDAIDSVVEALEPIQAESPLSNLLKSSLGAESQRRKSSPPGARKARPASASSAPGTGSAPARPSSRSSGSKPAPSIFGDNAISEQSLDEVILSYLAEDLEGGD